LRLSRFEETTMAVGDMFSAVVADLADDGSLTVQPDSGDEVYLDHVNHSTGGSDVTQIEIYQVNAGGTDLIMDKDQYPILGYMKGVIPLGIRIDNTNYITVKNVSGGAKLFVGAFGIKTKE